MRMRCEPFQRFHNSANTENTSSAGMDTASSTAASSLPTAGGRERMKRSSASSTKRFWSGMEKE